MKLLMLILAFLVVLSFMDSASSKERTMTTQITIDGLPFVATVKGVDTSTETPEWGVVESDHPIDLKELEYDDESKSN